MPRDTCPVCGSRNISAYLELGKQPLANELTPDRPSSISAERYDLALNICLDCLYVWLCEQVSPERLFRNNTYLTGISKQTRLDMKNLADSCINTCYFEKQTKVIDIGSNDGTLLNFFKDAGFEVLGIDPSKAACELARSKGITTINDFFGKGILNKVLPSFGKADIITGTNVITHVEDPVSFLTSCKRLLKPKGSIVLEFYDFEHVLSNIAFDQIYHEHVSYFDFTTFLNMVKKIGLFVYKVETVKSQGGSLRVFIARDEKVRIDDSVVRLLRKEGGFDKIKSRFLSFPDKVLKRKEEILNLIETELIKGAKLAGYGASAKATVLLNYLNITSDKIVAIADRNPIKQKKFIPGTGIPVISPEELGDINPDFIIIFPWNIRTEIIKEVKGLFGQDKRTVTFMPHITFSG